jgi:Fe-S oxidoreductase
LDDRGVEVLYQCLECSHCLIWCKPEIDIAELVEDRRRGLVSEGRYPKGLDKIVDAIREQHNPFGEPHNKRTTSIKSPDGSGTLVHYFTGCTAAYREQEIAVDTVSLLMKLDFSVSVSEDEWCCGSPLFRTGFTDTALEQARHNAETLNSIEAELIVVTCPGCYRVLTQDYPKYDIKISKPIKHISELLQENISKLSKNSSPRLVTYHDPCHLGRHMGIYDAPRAVINAVTGNSLVEMERHGDNGMCCGNGAGLRTLFPDAASKIGAERTIQARRTGADTIVTACPFCKNMLKSQSGDEIQVVDLPELVLSSLQEAEKS